MLVVFWTRSKITNAKTQSFCLSHLHMCYSNFYCLMWIKVNRCPHMLKLFWEKFPWCWVVKAYQQTEILLFMSSLSWVHFTFKKWCGKHEKKRRELCILTSKATLKNHQFSNKHVFGIWKDSRIFWEKPETFVGVGVTNLQHFQAS